MLQRATSMPMTPQPQKGVPPTPVPSGDRKCFKCNQTGHLAANCPIKTDWQARKTVVSKAVGLMMDAFEREDTGAPAQTAPLVGATIPAYAF